MWGGEQTIKRNWKRKKKFRTADKKERRTKQSRGLAEIGSPSNFNKILITGSVEQ